MNEEGLNVPVKPIIEEVLDEGEHFPGLGISPDRSVAPLLTGNDRNVFTKPYSSMPISERTSTLTAEKQTKPESFTSAVLPLS